jgi:putative transposase
MARQPRVEFEGALHHVMSRGNDGILIFRDDADRELFLRLLAEEIERSRWVLHDYSLMGNHYHLSIFTPECTLSTGMQRLLTRYAQRFNRRHGRRGHLFQERFKNVLVERESHGLVLTRYIALNPVRAGLCIRPEDWRWSSYAARAGFAPVPSWLTVDTILEQFGPTRAAQQQAYREFVLAGVRLNDAAIVESPLAGLFLGTAQWIDDVQRVLDGFERSEEHPRAQVHPGRPDVDDVLEAVASTFDMTPQAICESRGSLEQRLAAYFAFEEALAPLRRIGRKLGVTSAGHVSNLVARCRAELRSDPGLRELADACRSRMRRQPRPFLMFREVDSATARQSHRAPSRSTR